MLCLPLGLTFETFIFECEYDFDYEYDFGITKIVTEVHKIVIRSYLVAAPLSGFARNLKTIFQGLEKLKDFRKNG